MNLKKDLECSCLNLEIFLPDEPQGEVRMCKPGVHVSVRQEKPDTSRTKTQVINTNKKVRGEGKRKGGIR